MQLGASLPCGDIGTGAAVVRDYAQTMEGLGIDYLQAPDHVLGGNPASVPAGKRVGTTETAYHDPFVLFSFVAGCTQRIGFAPGVLILAQRQAALVAKQAASLDALVPGRLRLGVGAGWNELEFQGLNENFANRGRRSEEQVQVMQALWAQPHVTFKGKYHTLEDSGINPRPPSGRVPIWFGGHAEATYQRAAKYGTGSCRWPIPPMTRPWPRSRSCAACCGPRAAIPPASASRSGSPPRWATRTPGARKSRSGKPRA